MNTSTITVKAKTKRRTTTRRHIDRLPKSISIGRETCGDFDAAARREWLVTNGMGGYAAGTVAGARTRRYHGLLVAALNPPLGRTLLVAKQEVAMRYLDRRYGLSSNEYKDGTIDPQGFQYIESFALDGTLPVWRYAIADALLEQRIWMAHGENTTYLSLSLTRASAPAELEVSPLVAYRDYHAETQGGWQPGAEQIPGGVQIVAFSGARPFRLLSDRGELDGDSAGWFWNFRHRVESFRGLDDKEDLYCPGIFKISLAPGESVTFTLTAEPGDAALPAKALAAERRRQVSLLKPIPAKEPEWVRQLTLAADQFIVRRGSEAGRTVIAGYPWFGDWGRDTMIALPGLTITTGRYDIAASILRTFAGHVSGGMLPNRFPDAGETPEYNTVDATLWYFQAVAQYLAATNDSAFARELYPALSEIVESHLRGTRYSIHVDQADGLLYAGEPGVQLTWMDAKVGDWVVTPRIGKPVEINALWHNALAIMRGLSEKLGERDDAMRYAQLAERVAEQFCKRFWFEGGGYLYDVIDGPEGEPDASGRRHDASLRPNQIFAVSLPPRLLSDRQARAVVDVCARELYTAHGLRSLGQNDDRYVRRYGGGPWERDGAYHQGTVWSWLLGPFASAHYRVYGNPAAARAWLEGIAGHLLDGCLGNISEIFDADPPHAPRGCFAQAWSVAEVLRAWRELNDAESTN